MKQFFYLPVFSMLLLASCSSGYKKGDKGLEYKIISSGSGKTLVQGDFLQIDVQQMYKGKKKDTLLGDSRDLMPQLVSFDTATTPPAYVKILKEVRRGDSVVIRILSDSAYPASNPQPMPPFMEKGGYLYTTLKVLNIFKTREEADSANKAEVKLAMPKIKKKRMEDYNKQLVEFEKKLAIDNGQIAQDSKVIEDYLTKNNIKATKAKWGTYFTIHSEGTGDKITSESIVTVNYTGKTLDSGKVFDSNIDPQFQHVEPFQVTMNQLTRGVIPGWLDALMQLKKGDKVTIYIPSSLGYGSHGNPPKIGPNANLIFDIEITDVDTEEQLMAKEEENQKKMKEKEKMLQDSLKNASGGK